MRARADRATGKVVVWGCLLLLPPALQAQQPAESGEAAAESRVMALVKDRMGAAMRRLQAGATPERELSQAVDQAFTAAMAGVIKGDGQSVLDKLAPLARYEPLESFPSFRVQFLQAQAYRLLGDKEREAIHQVQALQLAQMRNQGRSPEAPLRLQHLLQLGDLMLIGGGKAKEPRFETTADGRRLMVVEFDKPLDGEARRYVQLPDGALRGQQVLRYAPLPTDKMPDELRGAIADARALLERFYADKALQFDALDHELREAVKAVDQLAVQQKHAEALELLQALARLRALDEIPHIPMLSRLSYLQGQLGNRVEQQRLRLKLFGLQQALGTTGDALSYETAMEVPFVAIEYDWLADRRLKSERQKLEHRGDKSYDVLDVVDEKGQRSKRYFDITRMWALRGADKDTPP